MLKFQPCFRNNVTIAVLIIGVFFNHTLLAEESSNYLPESAPAQWESDSIEENVTVYSCVLEIWQSWDC